MYTVTILSSQEFDDLPKSVTRGSDISDSLGFADVIKKKAYVRDTHWPELNRFLIDHELEHFMEKSATDEDENGLRHKKGGFIHNVFDPVGLFHAGNIAGVGHNEGKAGIGDTAIGSAIPGTIAGILGAINPVYGAAGDAANAASYKFFGGFPDSKNAKFDDKGMPINPGGSGFQGLFSNLFGSQGKAPEQTMTQNGFGSSYPTSNIQSLGQGFGQTGSYGSTGSSFSSSGMGAGGGQGAQMANGGLNGANISMGNTQNQEQSGFWRPSYSF